MISPLQQRHIGVYSRFSFDQIRLAYVQKVVLINLEQPSSSMILLNTQMLILSLP